MGEARAKAERQRPTLDDVLHTLRVHLPELREHYGVRTLGVFGSYGRGEQRPRSDLDLLVEFDERPLTLIQVIALEQYLSHDYLNRSTRHWRTPIIETGSRWSFGKSGWINLMWSDLGINKPSISPV